MSAAEFDAEAWVERLAQLLPPLAQAQEPFLREYQERHARVIDLRDGKPPPFPLEDLRLLYDEVRNGRLWGMEAHYAPLRAMLDPVRHALLGHPTLERVAVRGRVIGVCAAVTNHPEKDRRLQVAEFYSARSRANPAASVV